MAYKYKVGASETWSQIAAKFRTTVPQLMGINRGVSTLSTGMGIRVPQYSAPIGPQRINVTSSVGGLNAAQSNAGINLYDNNLTGYYNDAYSKPPTTTYPNILAQEQGRGLPPPTVTGRGTGNYNMNYKPPTTAPSTSPTTTGNIYNNPYSSIMYERDPVTGQPRYNYVQMRDQYGRPMTNRDGSPVTTPASIYANDVMTEARFAGQSVAQFTEDLKKNGYVLFGGKWVYVGTGTPQPSGQPARNAHGSLIRRRDTEPTTGGAVPGMVSTSSSNFGVGSG